MRDGDPGPYYDDLTPGHEFPVPTPITITSGLAAQHLALSGDALPISVDHELCVAVTGSEAALVSPALVMHVSIGASTVATRKVLANLFYRNVVLHRPVFEGETLRTTTRVAAMSDARSRKGVRPRGKVLLDIVTTSGDRVVAAYQRCPLLPCRGDRLPGHADEIGAATAGQENGLEAFHSAIPEGWDLKPLAPSEPWEVGAVRADPLCDVVDNATSLVRLSQNMAAVHRDHRSAAHQRRLVYGGHSVSLAQASLGRMLPGLVTVLGWYSCDHLAPVFEDDLLACSHELEADVVVANGRIRRFRTLVTAHRDHESSVVLDWRPVVFTTS